MSRAGRRPDPPSQRCPMDVLKPPQIPFLLMNTACLFHRKLHCTRNSIHIHFFTSFILRGAAVLIKDAVLFSDESVDHCTMSTVRC